MENEELKRQAEIAATKRYYAGLARSFSHQLDLVSEKGKAVANIARTFLHGAKTECEDCGETHGEIPKEVAVVLIQDFARELSYAHVLLEGIMLHKRVFNEMPEWISFINRRQGKQGFMEEKDVEALAAEVARQTKSLSRLIEKKLKPIPGPYKTLLEAINNPADIEKIMSIKLRCEK